MMRKILRIAAVVLAVWLLASCEKPVVESGQSSEPHANVMLRVAGFEQLPFADYVQRANAAAATRSGEDVGEVCTRLSFVVFSGDEKVKSVNQKAGDKDFGRVALNLSQGTYQVVVLAHNCDGNATFSGPSKITFPNNKVTDTFYYCDQLTVGDSPVERSLTLERPVSMFRLVVSDALPADVRKMKFYYTGGSSTFDAVAGYGNVNSRQTVNVDIAASETGRPAQFEVYTFLHDDTGTLKMTVTALDGADNILYEKTFEDVPMSRNAITRYTGNFFGGGENPAAGTHVLGLSVNKEWDGETAYNY